jgi:hypothetical protein
MPIFKLGECLVDLKVEPLTGTLAKIDRQLAWRLYLALVARTSLQADELFAKDLGNFIMAQQVALHDWPAAQIEDPRPGHLGHLIAAVIEMILLPCFLRGRDAPTARASVREFCHALARELASLYGFPDAGANMPRDLLAEWQVCG